MNASEQWVTEVAKQLECVKCRSKENLTLYDFHKKPIDVANTPLDWLKKNLYRLDFWCDNCKPKINTRVTGPGRSSRKAQAVSLADVVTKMANSPYDEYILANGHVVTKAKLIDAVKNRPCALCDVKYPKQIMEFHHILPKRAKVSSMPNKAFTVNDVIEEIQKCVLLCANCHRLVEYGYLDAPERLIILDGNFWRFEV